MLDWLLGRQVEDANRDEDSHEMPETPAPVFAARALKSAIFGTPAYREEDELEKPRQAREMNGKIQLGDQKFGGLSPAKPQGILVTPGSATYRRKTVSFGAGVVDNEGKDAISKSGVPNNCPGKFPSPYTPKVRIDEDVEPVRRTALIGSLEAARDAESKKLGLAKSNFLSTTSSSVDSRNVLQTSDVVLSRDIKRNEPAMVSLAPTEDFDADMTLDLNEPHSQSGRYWKSEYDRYHEEAIAQMTKLVKYKQLAKSYAKQRDSEAIDLAEKLKDEQQKVANMEAEISELTAQVKNKQRGSQENEDIRKNLAQRTAITREYRNQVDEFKIMLQESHTQSDRQSGPKPRKPSLTHAAKASAGTDLELNKGRDQLAEMSSLRDEMYNLRLSLSMAEKRVARLQDENARLAKDLTKMSDHMDKTQKQRQSAEAQSHERHILLQSLQNEYDNLKELAKSQRRDAEGLLKKRHSQVAKLKKEIRGLKEQASALIHESTNQATLPTLSTVLSSTKKEVAAPNSKGISDMEDLMSFEMSLGSKRRDIGMHTKLDNGGPHRKVLEPMETRLPSLPNSIPHENHIQSKQVERGGNHLLDSKVTELSRPIKESANVQEEGQRKRSGNILGPLSTTSKYTALSEIINDARLDNPKAGNQSLPANQLSTSFQERFSALSLNSPGPALPSPEPSFTIAPARTLQNRRISDSPRPSMFNIPSSPPRQMLPIRQASRRDLQFVRNDKAPSSRVSSMSSRGRVALPSDRAAAAKARLEQKSAEKKRAQELGEEKENVRV